MFDFTDIHALLFLIWNTVRKLDIQKQRAEDFPHVPVAEFNAWQSKELLAYRIGAYASMAKIVLNLGWIYAYAREAVSGPTFGWGGRAIFFMWGASLIASALLGTKGRAMRGDLGITLKARRD